MLVTLYITNYNYESFIKQSIESVLNQTLQNLELLIIDDGSIDNSKEIIENYRSNPKVHIIYQQNKGLNITNNIAMRMAKGKYIMRLDADDFLAPDALEKMSAVLEKDDTLGLVFPDYFYVDKDGNITGEEKRHDFDKEVSLYDQPAHGACTMIRLSFLKELGGYNESFTCQDGYDLWIKFITHYKITNINQSLFYYRKHSNNLTTNEEKILSTRKKIKEVFVSEKFKIPSTIAIIPVRDTFIGNVNLPLYKIQGETIIEKKIKECLKSSKLKYIVISTSSIEIKEHCENKFKDMPGVLVVERPLDYAEQHVSLNQTILQTIALLQQKNVSVEAVMTVSIEYPFLKYDVIDEAINTLILFKSDAVLSVRPDTRSYYQHTGHSLQPILGQDKFTRLEREALYKAAGGIALSTLENILKNNRVISGKISHVVVDELASFEVNSKLGLSLFSVLKEVTL